MLAAPEVRARIGLIIPSSNRLAEPQMHQYAPPGVEVHVTRLRMTGAHHVPVEQLLPRLVEATLALADARCDVIIFHCTASAMEAGLAGERHVLHAMRSATSMPVTTTASAAVAALRELGVTRLVLLSPYVAATHQHEVEFLAEAGVTVVGGHSLGLAGGDQYVSISPDEWLHLARQHLSIAAQGVFLSCTNIHSPQVIQPLETLIDLPVISSNQAVLWYALRTCGLADRVPALGRLFDRGLALALSATG